MDAFERICDWRSALLEVDTGVALEAKAIRQQVESRSNYFHSLGITHQTRVVILKSSSIDFFIDLAAVWRQRAIAIVVDSNQTPTELLSVINDIRPHFTINSTSVQRCAVEPVTALSLPDDACLILFTSGSSAKPKAVVHTARSLASRIDSIHQAIDPNLREVSFNVLPVHFGHGLVGVCLSALCLDRALALAPRISIHNAHQVGQWLTSSRASFMSGTPAIWKLIISLNERPNSSLKRAQCASARTGPSLFRKISSWTDAPIWNVYGLTECASWVADYPFVQDGDEQMIGDGLNWNTKFRLHDSSDAQFGRSLLLHTDGLFSHYLGKTSEQSGVSSGWLNTTDAATQTQDGMIRLLGRSTRLINRGGTKVAPEEVETVLLEHPDITDVVVFGKSRADDSRDDDVPLVAALVVGHEKLTPAELRSFLSHRLSEYKVPTLWRFVEAIPRTSTGKVDFSSLEKYWNKSSRGI